MREVLEAIGATARRTPERIAITDALGAMTYGELAGAIGGMCETLAPTPPVIGLSMPRDRRHVIADLALAALGRTIVPLPDFFAIGQWRHIVADAGVAAIVTAPEGRARFAALPTPTLAAESGRVAPIPSPRASRRIIYTSGTTGAPKGVMLAEASLSASLAGLAAAANASADDVYLSALPFSLLLEQLAGVLLPLKFGARIHIAASPQSAPEDAERVRATTSVLVPELLAGWVGWLLQTHRRAPETLRFVAVGGAPVGEALATAAWNLGLPVYEGYGLSECGSVVAVNRPGERRPGTVGWPLDGVAVTVEDGEIVVRGPTVMTGYVGGKPTNGVWRTGDAGHVEPDGSLVVLGRKDDVVVTANGRNIHPEWIEPMLLADPAIRACAVVGGEAGLLAAILPATPTPTDWRRVVRERTADAPDYARPTEIAVLTPAEAQAHALFTVDGRPRRRCIAQFLEERAMTFYDTLVAATTPERTAFTQIPIIRTALSEGVDPGLYLGFLDSAYHHVRYTVPLMNAALAKCGPEDDALADGLREYIVEETGHEAWILDDIAALGGDRDATRDGRPPLAVRAMVAMAYHLVAEEGPYALLGMVHVLEGMSVALADKAAEAIKRHVAPGTQGGFSYLISHGGLDISHVKGFADLLDAIDTPDRRATVIAAAREFYVLYGNIFRALAAQAGEASHAA